MVQVVFLHPDLGIGGAERLIVDAAVALQQKGHKVRVFTAHHDQTHCFPETKDGTISVQVHGDFLPRTIFGYCTAFCAYLRMMYLALCLLLDSNPADVIFIDQVSLPICILGWKTENIIFYCHFPDQRLSKEGGGAKKAYRYVLDGLEEWTTLMAKKIFVNSQFTSQVFMDTFKSARTKPNVLYPSLPTHVFDSVQPRPLTQLFPEEDIPEDGVIFLSLNRYERKKDISLAINAFALMREKLPENEWEKSHLIVAGGYDHLLAENIEHVQELETLVADLGIGSKVTFLMSPSDEAKISLLTTARCLLYTPSNEHFGIVPLEAMYLRTPVIAVSSGGPKETVSHSVTGFLMPPIASEWAVAMSDLVLNPEKAKKMGDSGRKRVQQLFSYEKFSSDLDKAVRDVMI